MNAEQLVSTWLSGRAAVAKCGGLEFGVEVRDGLPERFRRAYHWICSNALLSPFAEMEAGTPRRVQGDHVEVELHDEPGYSSFILLPLLNLMTSRRLVFVGARAGARRRWPR